MLRHSILYLYTFCICTIQAGNLPSDAVDGEIIWKSGLKFTQKGNPVKNIDKVLLKYEACMPYVKNYENATEITILCAIASIGFSVNSIIFSVKGSNDQNIDYLRTGIILSIPSTLFLGLSSISYGFTRKFLLKGIEIYNGIIKGSVKLNETKSSLFNNNSRIFGISYSFEF